jgi:hypothetical protein
LAFCLHGASQDDDDIYVMINAYWEELEFQKAQSEDASVIDAPVRHRLSHAQIPIARGLTNEPETLGKVDKY